MTPFWDPSSVHVGPKLGPNSAPKPPLRRPGPFLVALGPPERPLGLPNPPNGNRKLPKWTPDHSKIHQIHSFFDRFVYRFLIMSWSFSHPNLGPKIFISTGSLPTRSAFQPGSSDLQRAGYQPPSPPARAPKPQPPGSNTNCPGQAEWREASLIKRLKNLQSVKKGSNRPKP